MPETPHVFRSNHPSVIAAVEQAERSRDAFNDAVRALRAEVPFLADTDEAPLSVWRSHDATRASGFRWNPRREVPQGWRLVKAGGVTVLRPARRSKAGKALYERVMGLRFDMPSKLWPGMPIEFFPAVQSEDSAVLAKYGNRVFFPGIDQMAGYWWVTWGCILPLDMVNLDIWEPVLLSTYYLVVEAEGETDDVGC